MAQTTDTYSVRGAPETIDKFKTILGKSGKTVNDALIDLIAAYETKQLESTEFGKANKDALAAFMGHLNSLGDIATGLIQAGNDARVVAEQEYKTKLEAKDTALAALKKENDTATAKIKELTDQLAAANKTIKDLQDNQANTQAVIQAAVSQALSAQLAQQKTDSAGK